MAERLRELDLENEIPEHVSAIVMACLQKDLGKRPQTMRVIREWIQEAEEAAKAETVAPVQRKVAGAGPAGATPQPSFNVAAKEADDDDDEDGPWYKNKEKKKLGIVVAIFLLVFIPFGFPSVVSIVNAGWGLKVDGVVKPWKWFGGDNYRNNSTDLVKVGSIKILPSGENSSVAYVTGEAKNTSSETLEQVELKFHLFNKTGEQVGEAVEYKDKMGPNSTWNFKAPCTSTDVHRADLMKVIVR